MDTQLPGDEVARLRSGGEPALADYFVLHRPMLRRMVSRRMDGRLSKRVDASDILQEGYLDAARRLNHYVHRPSMPLLAWLKFLLHQRILAAYRRHFQMQKRDVRREESRAPTARKGERSSVEPRWEAAASCPTPSQVVAQCESRRQLGRALEQLPPDDRQIIHLRHVEQLNNSQVAQALGLSPSAASKRYLRALEKLQKLSRRSIDHD